MVYSGAWGEVDSWKKTEVKNLGTLSFKCTLGSTAGVEGRAGNCCQPLLGGSSLPFSTLLQLSRELPHAIQENRDSKYDGSLGIYKSLPDTWMYNWKRAAQFSFLGKYVSNFRYSVYFTWNNVIALYKCRNLHNVWRIHCRQCRDNFFWSWKNIV